MPGSIKDSWILIGSTAINMLCYVGLTDVCGNIHFHINIKMLFLLIAILIQCGINCVHVHSIQNSQCEESLDLMLKPKSVND